VKTAILGFFAAEDKLFYMETIVLLMCGKNKLSVTAKARDLYTSPRFRESLHYARTLTTEDNIFVLSAKYGLLRLEQEIAPYDKSIYEMPPQERSEWASMVFGQLGKITDINADKYIFLTDDDYCAELCSLLKNIELPLHGLSTDEHLAFFISRK